MMTDGVGRRLAKLRVQGLVRNSNGRRRRQRYQCRVVGSKPLGAIRKSLEAAVGYPVLKFCNSSRSQSLLGVRELRLTKAACMFRSHLLSEAEATGSNPVGRASNFRMLG